MLARQAAVWLSSKLHTHVSIDSLRIINLRHVEIKDLFVEDQEEDTLLRVH